ncbi:hypothetical protein ACQKFG_22170 [Peribacillus sp. NPDC076916]|uniref:hypothetical protein n=1 Tax=Peribacillus sp. NPDC076916 TaxID=3390608 RepID=UPI003D06D4EC
MISEIAPKIIQPKSWVQQEFTSKHAKFTSKWPKLTSKRSEITSKRREIMGATRIHE